MERYRKYFFMYFFGGYKPCFETKNLTFVRVLHLCIYFSQKTAQLILEDLP